MRPILTALENGFVVLGPLVEVDDGAWYQAAAFCALVAC